jgi:hypothetical protein
LLGSSVLIDEFELVVEALNPIRWKWRVRWRPDIDHPLFHHSAKHPGSALRYWKACPRLAHRISHLQVAQALNVFMRSIDIGDGRSQAAIQTRKADVIMGRGREIGVRTASTSEVARWEATGVAAG